MILPDEIMLKVSQHYAEHIEACHSSAADADEEALAKLMSRHEAFKSNVSRLLDIHMVYANTADQLAPGSDLLSQAVKSTLFSITLSASNQPVFPDFIGRHARLLIATWDDVHTALYSVDGYEEDMDDA